MLAKIKIDHMNVKASGKTLTFNVALAYTDYLKKLASLIKSTIIEHWKKAVDIGLSADIQIEKIGGFYPNLKKVQDTSFLCNDEIDYITIWSRTLFTKKIKKARRVTLCFKDLGIAGTVTVQFYDDKNEIKFETSIDQQDLVEEGFIYAVIDWMDKLQIPTTE